MRISGLSKQNPGKARNGTHNGGGFRAASAGIFAAILLVAAFIGATVVSPAASEEPAPTIRINAGGPAVTTGGVDWLADQYFSGGKQFSNPSVSSIEATTDDVLYTSERSASATLAPFSYAVPAPTAGTYTVRLHFAEIWFGAPGGGPGGAGKRVFSTNFEGGAVELANYDIFADVGAVTATIKTFSVVVNDGILNIDFTATVDQPKISAIEVIPPGTGTPTPTPTPTPTESADPTPFTWDTKENAPVPRSEAQGALIADKLYVFGGFSTTDYGTTARSDVYDPSSNSWSQLPDMPEQTTHSAVSVDGTSIWLVGGYVGHHPGPATVSVWKYETTAKSWTRGPSLPAPRGAGASAIIGRDLHFFGGTNRPPGSTADLDQPDHWVLSLDGGTAWVSKAPLPNPRNHLASAVIGSALYAIGGQHNENETSGLQADVHRYDPSTNSWTRVADLPAPRSHASAVVRDGQVVVIGGTLPGDVASTDVTMYHPDINVWSKLPSIPGARKTPVSGTDSAGNIYVTGGSFSVATWSGRLANRWETSTTMPVSLGEVASGLIGRNVYVVGEGAGSTLAFDVSTGKWTGNLPARPYPGDHHAAEVIKGKLYLFGGLGGGSEGKVQIFDPATSKWTLGRSMPFAAGSSSSAVIGGNVYVAGGIVGNTTTPRAASYNPSTNRWTEIAPMPAARNHAASATDGMKLFVVGGRGPGSGDGNAVANGFDTVQVYEPAVNAWKSSDTPGSGLTPLPQARGGMGKGIYFRGELYIFGGETLDGAGSTASHTYNRVDIYNPVTAMWRSGTTMLAAKHGIFPVLVGSRIVVAGGGTAAGHSSSSSVEIYNPKAG